MVGGSYTKLNVAALEEILCGLSTLIFEQNGDKNPQVLEPQNWIPVVSNIFLLNIPLTNSIRRSTMNKLSTLL